MFHTICIWIMMSSSISLGQDKKHLIGANYFYCAGLNYERLLTNKGNESFSFSINRHDWNLIDVSTNSVLLKALAEYRFFKRSDYSGLFGGGAIIYRYRDDPSIAAKILFILDEENKYAIRLHSWGLGGTGGYRSKLVSDHFVFEVTMRIGLYPFHHFSGIEHTSESERSESIQDGKEKIKDRLGLDFEPNFRISYRF